MNYELFCTFAQFFKSRVKMKTIKSQYYLVPAAICLALLGGLLYYYFLTSFSSSDSTSYLYVDADDTPDSVYAKLEPMASAHAMTGLRTLMRHCDYASKPRTGRFAIKADKSTWAVFRMLKSGQQEPVALTIPEARTMDKLAGSLARKLMLDSATVAGALHDSTRCDALGYDTCTVACMFVPNTYQVYWNVSLHALLQRMKSEHDKFWNHKRRLKAEAIGLSANEVCTLASIIDEETANNAEKPMIAGMYLNRLNARMPLQADPTIKFALQDFGLRRIYHNMLATDSPYNTYKNTGLPPGPIKIASIAGIDAVLNRVEHNYLYMCAKEDFSGSHNFAATYKEHLQNAAKYSKALNERGIK